MSYEEYDDDEEEVYIDAVAAFFNKMLLNSVFQRLPREFSYKQFAESFDKTFKKMGLDEDDFMKAFLMSIELEIIEPKNRGSEMYIFNGFAAQSDDWN